MESFTREVKLRDSGINIWRRQLVSIENIVSQNYCFGNSANTYFILNGTGICARFNTHFFVTFNYYQVFVHDTK